MIRRLVPAIALLATGAVLAAPALAAPKPKPKPFKKSFTYNDPTPDPTYLVSGGACQGKLPQEAPIQVNIPAPGILKVALDNTGDWALEVRDAKGAVRTSADGGTPETKEAVTLRIKRAGKYFIVPCNIGGAPSSPGTYSYKPA